MECYIPREEDKGSITLAAENQQLLVKSLRGISSGFKTPIHLEGSIPPIGADLLEKKQPIPFTEAEVREVTAALGLGQ